MRPVSFEPGFDLILVVLFASFPVMQGGAHTDAKIEEAFFAAGFDLCAIALSRILHAPSLSTICVKRAPFARDAGFARRITANVFVETTVRRMRV